MFTGPENRRNHRRPVRGLTLLEVVVGLAILGLMAGAIHAIVSGSVESAATLSATQTEDRRMETFLNRIRSAMAHFPTGASLELKVLESAPLRQEFILRGAPEAFIWGPNPRWDKPVITLCPRPWETERIAAAQAREKPGGRGLSLERYSLSMSVPDFFRVTDEGEPVPESPVQSRQGNQFLKPDEEGRFWLELLPEVERVEWRIYDPAKKLWLEQVPAGRPPLIELLLFLPGRTTPVREVFSIA